MATGRRDHHLVSAGLQRYFWDGKYVRLFAKDGSIDNPVSPRDAFKVKGFNSYRVRGEWVEDLEHEWERLETATLPAIRAIEAGNRSPGAINAVKVLIAVHYVRSYTFSGIFRNVTADQVAEMPTREAANPEMVKAFRRSFGRLPAPGEIEELVAERLDRWHSSRAFFVSEMTRIYNRVVTWLLAQHARFLTTSAARVGFVTGDVPVTLIQGLSVGVQRGIGLLSADGLLMTLSRRLAVTVEAEPQADGVLAPFAAQMVNHLVFRNCSRLLICHPDDEPSRCVPGWSTQRTLTM